MEKCDKCGSDIWGWAVNRAVRWFVPAGVTEVPKLQTLSVAYCGSCGDGQQKWEDVPMVIEDQQEEKSDDDS